MHRTTIALSTAILALAGCRADAPADDVGDGGDDPVPSDASETVSILRPDVVVPTPRNDTLTPLTLRISFTADGAEISAAGQDVLRGMMDSPQIALGGAIILQGHSDSGGSDAANLVASRARAETVRDWLVEHGIDASRIQMIAFGEQNPVEPNALPDGTANEAGRAANRRVDVIVLAAPEDKAQATSVAADQAS